MRFKRDRPSVDVLLLLAVLSSSVNVSELWGGKGTQEVIATGWVAASSLRLGHVFR